MKSIYISIICFFTVLCISSTSNAVERKEGVDNFPDSYRPYLVELQKRYPNWSFTALYTGLDWNYVINNENLFGKNLVPNNYSDRWKNTREGIYNLEVDAGWVDSSRQAIEYAMDPRNFLNYVRVFQFEGLSYNQRTNNIESIEKILYGTEFYNRLVQYVDDLGNTYTMNKKYSDLILSAGQISGVSSNHLASRIKQEVGPFLSHNSISGIVSGYRGLYNFYNIGATSSAEPMGAIKNGLRYARDGKGASQSIKDLYLIPWNTKERAISGGAKFIGSSYINKGQDTVYLQKFQVVNDGSGELFWHQYMTNVLAPYSESKSIYNGYMNTGILDSNLNFIIPIYNNMPEIPAQSPSINPNDFVQDNKKVFADVSTTLNMRSGPSTSYEVVASIDRSQVLTRIARGVQSGELWDRVILSNGMVGYVFHSYLKDLPQLPVRETNLNIQNKYITGWNFSNMNVRSIKNEIGKINSGYNIDVYSPNGNILSDNSLAGTGSIIRVVDANRNIANEYTILLYGDINGDGKINSIDLLVLQRHILEIERLNGVYAMAGNIRKNGRSPSSLDSLFIQRHILELEFIEQ